MSVVIRTNLGDMKFELYCDLVPRNTTNFLKLAASGYYDDCLFHRVIRNYLAQGGDPSGTGKGGKAIDDGYEKDEIFETLRFDEKGILAMSNLNKPDTIGSQFFITMKATPELNGKYTVIGRMVEGAETLDKISSVSVGEKYRPVTDVKIESIEILGNPIAEKDIVK
jgi:peptidyl-prolyl cis-trans isomerase-like 3